MHHSRSRAPLRGLFASLPAMRRGSRAVALLIGLLATVTAGAADPVLPRPEQPFRGHIGTTYADSTAAWDAPTTAPAGAPNVLLVLTDDVGFGAAATFGGPIPTPNLDRIAADGLRFNRFHTTAMCSPTRAALLTGRNHHAVGNGIVANLSTGFPGYDNLLPKSAATIAEILRQNGYNTAMFGKHHNAPEHHVSPAGPFDLWPTGLGFEYFFGFMAAETNQFTPALYRGTTKVPTLTEGVLDKALADDAISWLHQQQAAAPGKPFFMYFAPGSAHAPLQAPADWIARFRGQFDGGYDRVRAATVTRQKAMGLIPRDTVDTPRPAEIAAWDALTPDQRRINARFMEVYAAMLAYQDAQFGRLIDEIARMGLRDNTLVIFIEGDNGAAAEGGMHGSLNPMSNFANGTRETEAAILAKLDELGGPDTVPNYGFGWTWATNAPLRLAKQYASHLGGVRNGMVMSWPKRIGKTGVRSQFAHLVDIAPTILEAAGIPSPGSVNGVVQQPVDGSSLLYAIDDPRAPERHTTQYFEMMGNRAIYHDGWMANTTPPSTPWMEKRTALTPDQYAWELYDLRRDFSQSRDLAAKEPARLAQLQALFLDEATRNGVLPLDNRLTMDRFLAASSQVPRAAQRTYWGAGISVPYTSAVQILNRPFTVSVELESGDRSEGVLMALGSKFGGWSFFLRGGVPVAVMAASQLPGDQSRVAASESLPAGRHVLAYRFVPEGRGPNAGGELRISVDGRAVGRGHIARTISKLPELTDTLDIGFDADTPVTNEYSDGGHFNGTLSRLDLGVDAP